MHDLRERRKSKKTLSLRADITADTHTHTSRNTTRNDNQIGRGLRLCGGDDGHSAANSRLVKRTAVRLCVFADKHTNWCVYLVGVYAIWREAR